MIAVLTVQEGNVRLIQPWRRIVNNSCTAIIVTSGVHVQLADELESLMNNVQFKDGWLSGGAWGDVRTDDAERHRANTLLFSPRLRATTSMAQFRPLRPNTIPSHSRSDSM
jgi:hypothetical protein